MHLDLENAFILILIFCAGAGIVLAVYTLRHRNIAGVRLVGVTLLLSAWSALSYAFALLANTTQSRLFWVKADYFSIVLLIPYLLVFTLRYTAQNRILKAGFYVALAVEPLVVLALVWTTPLTDWFYRSVQLVNQGGQNLWLVEYGPAFWVHSIYGAAIYLLSVGLLAGKAIRSHNRQRMQSSFILLAVLLVGLGDVIYVTRISPFGYDFTSLLCLFSGTVVAWNILRSRIFELSPIALGAVLKSMADGVIMLDPRGLVSGLNPAAERITGCQADQAVAQPLEKVWPALSSELSQVDLGSETSLQMEIGSEGEQRTYKISVSPVSENQRHVEGRLVLMHDITELTHSHLELTSRELELRKARNFLEKVIATVPLGVSIYDLDSQKIEYNNRNHTLSGRSLDEYNQMSVAERERLVHAEDMLDRSEVIRSLARMADGEIRDLEYRRKENEGWAWTRMYYAVFERNDQGQATKLLTISEDISQYKRILENLAESEKQYRSLFEGLLVGLYRTTRDGKLLDANQAMVNLLGYPDRETLLSRNVFDLYFDPNERVHQQALIDHGEPIEHYELQLMRWDGEVIWVSDTPRSIVDDQGQQIFEGSLEDISRRKRIERELQASEEKFRNVFDLSPYSVMLADLSGSVLDCNIGTCQMHELENKTDIFGIPMANMVSTEDHPRLNEMMQSTLEDGGVRGIELTLARLDGSTFPAELSTSVVPNPNGVPQMMIITAVDITSRKEAEGKLHDTQAQLAQRVQELETRTHQITLLTEMSNMLQVCQEPAESYNFVGRYAARLFPGVAGALMILDANRKKLFPQACWGDLEVEPAAYSIDDCWALRSGQAYLVTEGHARLCRHFHGNPELSSLCVPILSEGEIIGIINLQAENGKASLIETQVQLASVMAEQIGLALSNLQLRLNLREQAIHDPLTGLYNRYHLREVLENELSSAQKNATPVSVVMIDLDYFKSLNTRYGHLNVDTLLGEFGRLMLGFAHEGEVALRYGGDEFVLILPDTSLERAADRAEQFKRRVRQLVVPLGDQSIQNLTLSIGIAGWPQHGDTFSDLLKAADAALFRAKEYRDRVMIAE